jgi:hypothetical protein
LNQCSTRVYSPSLYDAPTAMLTMQNKLGYEGIVIVMMNNHYLHLNGNKSLLAASKRGCKVPACLCALGPAVPADSGVQCHLQPSIFHSDYIPGVSFDYYINLAPASTRSSEFCRSSANACSMACGPVFSAHACFPVCSIMQALF